MYFDLFLFCLLEQETSPLVLFLLYYLLPFYAVSLLSCTSVDLSAPIEACNPGFVIQQKFVNFVLSRQAFFFLHAQPHGIAESPLLRLLAQNILLHADHLSASVCVSFYYVSIVLISCISLVFIEK